jgi:diguanylate cyclase (GGDEF)-like protein/PAS domain S-box-containing protein
MAAPVPANESERLDALRRYHVLDTPPESGFDDITRLAAAICGTPISLVSLVDCDRLWFKSRVGLDATETPRDQAFCAHAIQQFELFVAPDPTADERFAGNPLVTGDLHIRFYAGMPLTVAGGHNLGTLCVMDRVPRRLTADQQDALRVLARQVVAQLQLRKQVEERSKESETFRVLFEHSSDAHLIFDERDGILDCNHAAVAMLRLASKEEVLALHPAVLSPEFQPCGRRSMDKCVDMDAAARRDGYHRFDWTHRRADGEEFACEVTLTPVKLHGRSVLLVVWHDLTERKQAEDELRYRAALLRSLTESGPDGILVVDRGDRILSVNRRFFDIWQIPTEVAGAGADTPVLAAAVSRTADPDRFRARVKEIYANPELVTAEEIALADGRVLERHSGPVRDGDGRLYGRVWYFREVTARKRAEEALRQSAERFSGAFDFAPIGMAIVAPDGRWLKVNRAVCDILGYEPDELLATDFQTLTHPDDLRADLCLVGRLLAGEIGSYQMEKRYFRKSGAVVHALLAVSLVRDDAGRPLYFISHVQDVTAKREAEERLRRYQADLERANAQLQTLATTDRLTGVKNRGAFNDALDDEFDRAARYGHPLSVVLLDVDHFKLFNDTFGHPAGDTVLRAVAGALLKTVRSTDTVARYGGEEFVILLPETDYAGAMVLAERCRRAVAGVSWDKRPVTVSVGVATRSPATADATALVQQADNALYCSKHAGRNRVSYGSGTIPMPALRT